MNKKILSVIAAVLLIIATLTFAACKDPSVLELYDGVKDAKSIVQQVSVKSGSSEIATETLTYNFTAGNVIIVKKVLNDASSDEAFTTTTKTRSIQKGDGVANLTESTLSNITTTSTALKAAVANDKLNNAFGIEASTVAGDATVEMIADGGKIVKLTVNYTSSNGNSVEIVTSYMY